MFFQRPAGPLGRPARARRSLRGPDTAPAELLEDRTLLTAYVVDTTADTVAADGHVSLREAVQAASTNAAAGDAAAGSTRSLDTITFAKALDGTAITLGSQLVVSGGALTITGRGAARLTISGGDATRVFSVSAGATLSLKDLTVAHGFTTGSGGGATVAGTLVLSRCAVTANAAGGSGGGIAAMSNSSAVRIDGCTISRNTANAGGGLASTGSLAVSDSTISGNKAKGDGGGLFANVTFTSSLRNVTVFGNRADSDGNSSGTGGGVFIVDNLSVVVVAHNTLVAGNRRGGAGTADDAAGPFRGGSSHNLIADAATAGGLTDGANGNIVGADVSNVVDATLADNGGPTRTHRLLAGSLAIDAGLDTQARDSLGALLTADQRGLARVAGVRADIGAYEHQIAMTVDQIADEDDGNYSASDVSLREAVEAIGDGGTVSIAASLADQTITLVSGQITISRSMTVRQTNPQLTTVDAHHGQRVFLVRANTVVALNGLVITGAGGGPGNPVPGAGILNGGTLTLVRCEIRNNAGDTGGGIFNQGTLRMSDCTVARNTAVEDGGGLVAAGAVQIVDCTFSGNSTNESGGGIFAAGSVTLRNVTIFGNRANVNGTGDETGGGLFLAGGTASLFNTLVAGNLRGPRFALTPDDISAAAGHSVAGFFSLVTDAATAGGLADGSNGNIVGSSLQTLIDPVLKNNGGPTRTHKLLVGSQAIDAGSADLALGTNGAPLKSDQREGGFGRVRQSEADIGAFEADAADDLSGFFAGSWFVGETTGTAFDTSLWASWSNVAWQALKHGDFNGDGRSDVLGLFGGQWFAGLSNGDSYVTSQFGTWANVVWDHVTVGDFDGDGRDDVIAEIDGQWFGARSNGVSFDPPALRASTADAAWDFVGLSDVTGEGLGDLVLMLDGQVFLGTSDGSAFAITSAPAWQNLDYQFLTTADVNGVTPDHRADLIGFAGGAWFVAVSDGVTFRPPVLRSQWANVAWADPLVGDFDGDGHNDLAARANGQWFVGTSGVSGQETSLALWATWSNVAWRDVRAGDFDGDGRDDIAGRFNGQWFVAESNGTAFTTTFRGNWAEVAWLAVAATDATGPQVATASGGGDMQQAAPAAGSSSAATSVAFRTAEKPLAMFWSRAARDDEFGDRLLGAA